MPAPIMRRLCAQCNEVFQPVRSNQILCSKKCREAKYQADKAAKARVRYAERACKHCDKPFTPVVSNQLLCSDDCRAAFYCRSAGEVQLPGGTVGAIAELHVAADLLQKGWAVFRALSPCCFCDLVAFKDGKCLYLEVRTGSRNADGKLAYPKNKSDNAVFAVWVKDTNEVVYVEES